MRAVITGATSGIGLATASLLAGRGVCVLGVGRDAGRCEAARAKVLENVPGACVEYLVCDLSSQVQVRALTQEILARAESLDILVNNAGVVSTQYVSSEDGIELQFAVNHLAPFLLTNGLLPLLRRSEQGRVVTVSSDSHYGARLDFNDLLMRKKYSCLGQYRHVKLCNVLFTAELNRRLGKASRVRAFAVDPGLVKTEIGLKGLTGIERLFWIIRMRGGSPPDVPAACIAFLATDPSLSGSEEIYWKDCAPKRPDRRALDEDAARCLWEASERYCGIGAR